MRKKGIGFILLLIGIAVSCIQEFPIPESSLGSKVLVVEGHLGSHQSEILLTKSTSTTSRHFAKVLNATVEIVDMEETVSIPLPMTSPGRYRVETDLIVGANYKVKISAEDKEYVTDPLNIVPTPEIDSLSFSVAGNNIKIEVTTHDDTRNTGYYSWTFEEDWEFHSTLKSGIMFVGDTVDNRTAEDSIHHCWDHYVNNRTILRSTEKLVKNQIFKLPIIEHNANNSKRFTIKYSVLVKQYGLTEDAFNFKNILRKNTEVTGSFFDAQPSQLPGNINCITDPETEVIGFISSGEVTEKRIFIEREEIPESVRMEYQYPVFCRLDPVLFGDIHTASKEFGIVPVEPAYDTIDADGDADIVGIFVSTTFCVDCRAQGGSLMKPDFWETPIN